MVETRGSARRRRWADVVVIGASAYALAAATQVPLELATGDVDAAVGFQLWPPVAYAAGGALGLFSAVPLMGPMPGPAR